METHVIVYDPESYPFRQLVEAQLDSGPLERLHEVEEYALFTRKTDQSTKFHERFYAIGEEFYDVYREFLRDVVRPIFGEDLIYQRVPSFRVSLAGNVAVGEFHRDGDYGHGEDETNVWLPVTKAFDTNTVWIESEPDAGDFTPHAIDVGEALIFDGVNLRHGNKQNETGATRVSFDFRVIPASKYVPRDVGSINTGLKFKIGEDAYFMRLT